MGLNSFALSNLEQEILHSSLPAEHYFLLLQQHNDFLEISTSSASSQDFLFGLITSYHNHVQIINRTRKDFSKNVLCWIFHDAIYKDINLEV